MIKKIALVLVLALGFTSIGYAAAKGPQYRRLNDDNNTYITGASLDDASIVVLRFTDGKNTCYVSGAKSTGTNAGRMVNTGMSCIVAPAKVLQTY